MPVRPSRRRARHRAVTAPASPTLPTLAILATLSTRSGRRSRPAARGLGAAIGVVLLVAGLLAAGRDGLATGAADAAVTPTSGFAGTVAGWTSWYGAYDLGGLGWAWCIDHGSSAPDPDLAYVPTSIAAETDAGTRAAMAWAVTMNHPHDAVTAAALMLALHDLRGAVYPTGPLDLDRLGPADLAGFGGAEGAVLDRARAIHGDALAHAHLRAPFTLGVAADRSAPGTPGALRLDLTDAAGQPVAGVAVRVEAVGAVVVGEPNAITGDDGAAWLAFEAGTDNRFAARATLPQTEPGVFAPTAAPAQRVIVPASATVDGADAYALPPDTTTSTTTVPSTTTTTTRPSTTTTSTTSTTTTTRPPPPTTATTRPSAPSTTTSTTSPATTTSVPATTTTTTAATPPSSTPTTGPTPPAPPPSPPTPTRPTLPRTGRAVWPWTLVGVGLVACGWALTGATRRAGRPHEPSS